MKAYETEHILRGYEYRLGSKQITRSVVGLPDMFALSTFWLRVEWCIVSGKSGEIIYPREILHSDIYKQKYVEGV